MKRLTKRERKNLFDVLKEQAHLLPTRSLKDFYDEADDLVEYLIEVQADREEVNQ